MLLRREALDNRARDAPVHGITVRGGPSNCPGEGSVGVAAA